jgi:predicted alpha/beta-fold hydrolase
MFTVKLPRPFLIPICFYLSLSGVYPRALASIGIILLLSLITSDFQFNVSILKRYGLVKPGFYSRKTKLSEALQRVSDVFKFPFYHNPTPYLFNGEWQTIIPFAMYSFEPYKYLRVWVRTIDAHGPSDRGRRRAEPASGSKEAVAVDWAFPLDGYNAKKTVYLVLHGLNGGSKEEYVLDFVNLATTRGHTVAIMIARGLSNTPIINDSFFNGARTDDIEVVSRYVRACVGKDTKIGGVGFSMGGKDL